MVLGRKAGAPKPGEGRSAVNRWRWERAACQGSDSSTHTAEGSEETTKAAEVSQNRAASVKAAGNISLTLHRNHRGPASPGIPALSPLPLNTNASEAPWPAFSLSDVPARKAEQKRPPGRPHAAAEPGPGGEGMPVQRVRRLRRRRLRQVRAAAARGRRPGLGGVSQRGLSRPLRGKGGRQRRRPWWVPADMAARP